MSYAMRLARNLLTKSKLRAIANLRVRELLARQLLMHSMPRATSIGIAPAPHSPRISRCNANARGAGHAVP